MANIERILIVDDEPDFVEACRRTFGAKSYEVISASTGAQAQDMVKADPNVILLGTLAPAGQAFAFHQWLKQHPRRKDIPLLVIDSRYEDRSNRGWRRFEGMQLEADDYVAKPVEPSSLVPRIQSLLEHVSRLIRVLVADDHTMVRDGISAVLGLQKDIEVVAEAVDGQDAIDKALRLLPNIALMDIVMPKMSGLEATQRLNRECPYTKVLILTQYDAEENMVAAKNSGAYGFIPKMAAGAELITGIRAVYGGDYYPSTFAEMSAS
jgi:DNA-binding NarL/FixJ family response regulator